MTEPAAVEPPRLPNEEQAKGPEFVDTDDQDNDEVGDLELPEDFEDEGAAR
ncbi:hypothetical protein [Flindersiella endophytica]